MRRLIAILIGLTLGSCQLLPILAAERTLDTIDQRWIHRPNGDSALSVTVKDHVEPDSTLVSLVWSGLVLECLTWHPDSGAMYNDPIGPWPCRWIRSERIVAVPKPSVQFYTVSGGVAYLNETYETLEYTSRVIVDSLWHCEGDGVFVR